MIYGEKTRLRRIEREDVPTFVRWFSDPEVRKFLLVNSPISHAQEEKWFERKLADDDSELFAIETLDGTHIGNIELFHFHHIHRQAELGVVLGEKTYWGQGYGSDGRDDGQPDAGDGIEQVDVELAMGKGNLVSLQDIADFRSGDSCDGDGN